MLWKESYLANAHAYSCVCMLWLKLGFKGLMISVVGGVFVTVVFRGFRSQLNDFVAGPPHSPHTNPHPPTSTMKYNRASGLRRI